jgi:hypothetical protein
MALRTLEQIWSVPSETSEEDGNHSTRPICLHILRQEHSQATFGRNLDLQSVQENGRWWCMDSLVSRGPDLPRHLDWSYFGEMYTVANL